MTLRIRRTGPTPTETPLRQESLRTLNLALVFRQILAAAGQPISRTELVESTGLTRPTISRIVEELLSGRLVAETGLSHDGRAGRPRVVLTLSRRGPAGLGLDIRADGLAACVVDLTGAVRHLAFAPGALLNRPAAEVLTDLADMAQAAITAAAREELTVVAGTLAVPGAVEAASVVRFAPALGWRNVDAGSLLRRAATGLDLPVTVDNEANLAALGELYAGENDLTSFAYVSGGLDIGAGIVLDGHLMRGARGWSGELGHVTVYPDGHPCPCGSHGCLQTYASVAAILGGRTDEPGPTPDTTILALADAGNPAILSALDTAATALGIALSDMVNLLDVDTVLLGGSYSLLASWLTDRIQAELTQRVLTAGWAPIEVRPALLGPDAAVLGAALTSIDHVRRNPSAWLSRLRPAGV